MTTGDPADRTFETAMDWLLRLQASPGDSSLRAAADAWRRSDPAHAGAWARAEETWRLVGDVAPMHADEWPARAAAGRSGATMRISRRRVWPAFAGAALAACLALLFLPGLLSSLRADYVTATAERREVSLPDGSRVSLAPRTALDVRVEPDRRMATLIEGEAFFDVAPDPKRPFLVLAAGVEVTVVGTSFDVGISRERVAVSVRRGMVDVRDASQAGTVRLAAGDRAIVDRATRQLAQDKLAPSEVASWRDGRLFVDGASVGEVVDELGRHHSAWIVIGDSRLAKQRVTGLFDLNDLDRALAALVEPFDGRVHKVTPFLQVLTAP